jgi:hypothetical protein
VNRLRGYDSPKKSYPPDYNALNDSGFGVSRCAGRGRGTAGNSRRAAACGRRRGPCVEYDEVPQMPIRAENRQTQRRLSAPMTALAVGERAVDWIKEHRDVWHLSEADAAREEVTHP